MFDNFRADINRWVYLSGGGLRIIHFIRNQGLWACAEYRYSHWVHHHVRIPIIRQIMKLFGFFWHKFIQITTGIDIPETTVIGKGLYIGHFGTIIVSPLAVLGENCNLSQDVTIGMSGRGEKRGAPVIGDRVYFGAGCRVIGPIKIGNDVAIGANAVVTKDLPNNAVAVGIPAKVISLEGSKGLIRFFGEDE